MDVLRTQIWFCWIARKINIRSGGFGILIRTTWCDMSGHFKVDVEPPTHTYWLRCYFDVVSAGIASGSLPKGRPPIYSVYGSREVTAIPIHAKRELLLVEVYPRIGGVFGVLVQVGVVSGLIVNWSRVRVCIVHFGRMYHVSLQKPRYEISVRCLLAISTT